MPQQNVQYKLNIPPDVYEQLQALAEENNTTVANLLRQGIKWQLLLGDVKKQQGSVYIARNEEEKKKPIEVLPSF